MYAHDKVVSTLDVSVQLIDVYFQRSLMLLKKIHLEVPIE